MPFDTSSIPDDATITSGALNLFPQSISNHDNDGDDFITLVNTSQANTETLSKDDFDQAGSINNPAEGVNVNERKDITTIATGKYLSFNLNSTGLSWISKTNVTKLGLREGHDVIDSAFTNSSSIKSQFNYISFNSSEYPGTTQDPYLSVTYTQSATIAVTTTTAGNEVSYQYDQAGQRVKKIANGIATLYPFKHYEKQGNTVTKYLYAGDNLIATVETNNAVEYMHTDHLGSTSVITDKEGFVSAFLDYYPYGEKRTGEGVQNSNKQFIGEYFDEETELNYLNARYYDGGRGRFVSADPASQKEPEKFLEDPQQLNMYSYARNNPVVYVDTGGESIINTLAKVLGFAGSKFLGPIGFAYDLFKPLPVNAGESEILTQCGSNCFNSSQMPAGSAVGSLGSTLSSGVDDAVTVYRVEGTPNTKMNIGKNGSVNIFGKSDTLFVNAGDPIESVKFLKQKIDGNMPNPKVKSFQVNKEFIDYINDIAVDERDAQLYKNLPFKVHTNHGINQFGLRGDQITKMIDNIIPHSGKDVTSKFMKLIK